jgi:hypothetical protein
MRSACVPIDQLGQDTKSAMTALLHEHFVGVTRDLLEADLCDKSHAVLLFDRDDELAGFSTFALYAAHGPNRHPATVVCSGDTIVATRARKSSLLASAWVRAVHELHAQSDRDDLYWLLITSGYRTYRFLPVFVKDFYPAAEQPPSPEMRACLDRLAQERWAEQYDPATGIVRLTHAQPLRSDLSAVPEARRRDPHIAHFLRRNPGHARGDELASLARLNVENLTPAGLRMLDTNEQRLARGGTLP